MLQQALNAIQTAAIVAIVGVIGFAIKSLGEVVIAFGVAKVDEIKAKAGSAKFDVNLKAAQATFAAVDENFRITDGLEKTVDATQEQFKVLIKKLVPAITDEQIEVMRQAVAGQINAGKAALKKELAPTLTDKEVTEAAPTTATPTEDTSTVANSLE